MPPMTAERVYGSTMSQATSHVVEPSAYADSLSRVGTVRNTSRMTEEMNGITMIASTMPAVSMPMPSGGPRNSAPITGRVRTEIIVDAPGTTTLPLSGRVAAWSYPVADPSDAVLTRRRFPGRMLLDADCLLLRLGFADAVREDDIAE